MAKPIGYHEAIMNTATQLDLDTPYALAPEQIARYRRDGCITLSDVLAPEVLAHYGREISREVAERSRHYQPLAQRDTYGKAFLQISNIWTWNAVVKEFVLGQRLGRLAAELMGTRGARVYHDQALYKEPGGGMTPWHADQFYWPLSTDHSVTAWIPLQATPLELGPLVFALGSQSLIERRRELGLHISDDSERIIGRTLADCPKVEAPFALGDVSFHAGWCFHRAGANRSTIPREVMTIIYIDSDMVVGEPANDAQSNDLATWFPGLEPGDLAASPLNPVVWER